MVAQRWQAQRHSEGKRAEEEEGTPRGSAAFYRWQRRLEKGGVSCGRSGGGSEAMGTTKRRRLRSKCGRHGRRRCSERAADGWAPAVSDFFQCI
jgi:hypothetical protein